MNRSNRCTWEKNSGSERWPDAALPRRQSGDNCVNFSNRVHSAKNLLGRSGQLVIQCFNRTFSQRRRFATLRTPGFLWSETTEEQNIFCLISM